MCRLPLKVSGLIFILLTPIRSNLIARSTHTHIHHHSARQGFNITCMSSGIFPYFLLVPDGASSFSSHLVLRPRFYFSHTPPGLLSRHIVYISHLAFRGDRKRGRFPPPDRAASLFTLYTLLTEPESVPSDVSCSPSPVFSQHHPPACAIDPAFASLLLLPLSA